MSDQAQSSDITQLNVDGKQLVLIGTAHISQRSVEIVEAAIEREQPDSVCVELDEKRYEALVDKPAWDDLDLIQIIKKKQTTFLLARLALMGFQKRMSSYTGVQPGAEMLSAVEFAKTIDADIVLIDRDISTTLLRAWRQTPFFKRAGLGAMLFMSLFEKSEVDEESLEDLRETENLGEMMDAMGESFPSIKTAVVDERDLFMADAIRNAPGDKVLAVIGAAHMRGIVAHLKNPPADPEVLAELDVIPPKSSFSKIIPYLLPTIILAIFVLGFIYGDQAAVGRAAVAWFLVNGVLAALGTAIALGHPLTIAATFVAAPFTSLNPTIGAGMVAGFVQTMVASPKVRDFENIGDDITVWTGWWKNRLSRVLLVFVLANLGSTAGTFASFHWLKDVF